MPDISCRRENTNRAAWACGFLALIVMNLFATFPARAQFENDSIKIGVLTDMAGPISAYNGAGSVMAARMAIDEFGGSIAGHRIELLSADHQNKPDVGSAIARQWFANERVDAIADLASSAVGFAVVAVAAPLNKVVLVTGAGSTDFVGKACSATSVLWSWDTYSIANATVRAVVGPGTDNWFFITSDYAFGHAFEASARAAVEQGGGKVLGAVRTPFGTADFSSQLLQAQQSGANVVAFATSGVDTTNAVKQAGEFGLSASGIKVVPLQLLLPDIRAIGLADGKNTLTALPFYHGQSLQAEAWSKAFLARTGYMPSQNQAGTYSGVRAYLQAVQDSGTDDGPKVLAQMRATPVNDAFTSGGRLREDGLMVHDDWLVRIKAPAESQGPWDLVAIEKKIPGDTIYRKLADSDCPLMRGNGVTK